jgi:hypothetical protein
MSILGYFIHNFFFLTQLKEKILKLMIKLSTLNALSLPGVQLAIELDTNLGQARIKIYNNISFQQFCE